MKLHHGWAFPEADEFMAKELKADGTYQASHLAQALAYVTDFSLAVDGGAHVGTWSRLLSGMFDKVIAVEPCGDTFEALSHNMQVFDCTNVQLYNVALGAEPGLVDMILDGRGLELRNTGARHVKPGDSIVCVAVDGWEFPRLGFLKLDVEGSELAALEGAVETIRRCHPIILFEDKGLWKRYGLRRNAPQQFLASIGYRHLVRAGCDEIWGPVQ